MKDRENVQQDGEGGWREIVVRENILKNGATEKLM